MPWIGERDLFVFGPRILSQHVAGLEVDGLGIIEHCPHTLTGQHLLSFVSVAISVFDQDCGLGSRHVLLLALFML
jgi:hypothetical protein